MLDTVEDPVGPENDQAIRVAALDENMVVCAWGNHGAKRDRSAAVRALLAGRELHALKVSKEGEPCHPLYLPYKLEPKVWTLDYVLVC